MNGPLETLSTSAYKADEIDPRYCKWTALHYAAFGGNALTTLWLLQNGADPFARDRRGSTALHLAAHYGEVKIIKLLCLTLWERDDDGNLPLHWAARAGQREAVRLLCDTRDAKNYYGWTAATMARACCHEDVLDLLSFEKG